MNENEEMNRAKPENKDKASFPTLSRIDSVEQIGTQIGPYKLLGVLGEGGFGIVYRAEQKEPVRRQVALKVIKPGMDSKQVIARFESERQALALLDHPNVAHVFDGGTTESGRPYFVMELVKGQPITEYCDEQKLSVEERLELFQQVCEAVQHAHQKGIIHRDIKPSNILVSVHAGKPVPMIIDFGVAKAISQPLTERTLFTEQGQFIGTPEYMSPEQAGKTIRDIDTRSDIYSLGVLLYELLTGTLPFDRKTLHEAAFDEIIRIIRDEEPPRPSTRLSGLGEDAQKAAQSRRTEVKTLTKRLHKELEWIPLKAMRKEPARRYKTASELADDIRNYLNGDPLIAGPESATYRLMKTVKRHQAFVTGVAAVLFVLMAGIIVSTIFAIGQAKERHKAEKLAADQVLLTDKLAEEAAKTWSALGQAKAMIALLNSANRLDLSDSAISEIHLEHLAGASGLESLDLQNTQITDLELANIKDIVSLKGLFLGRTKITDVGMVNLKNLTGLQSLCVHNTQIGDAGLPYLSDMKSIKYLCLADTKVSNAGLVYLKGLTSLQDLRLEGTQVSNTGLSEIKQALPNCRISGPHPSIAMQRDAKPTQIASPNPKPEIPAENLKIPEELQACAANLQKIYTAIKKHEGEKGRLPDSLSDLIPAYMEKEVLWCPNDPALTGGKTPDPNIPYSYGYEFSSTRIEDNWPIIGGMRWSDWKKQQMKLFGDVVPMVRCSKHGSEYLNLSAGGKIYVSPLVWERMFVPDYTHGDEFPDVPRTKPASSAEKLAPPFTLKDLTGRQVSLSDFKGKVVLLDFWATWCGPCRTAIPHLEALHKKYKDQGLVVIGMNHEKEHDKVKKFAQEQISYIVLLDADEQFKQYGITSIPTAFYLDRNGMIRYREVGFSPGSETEVERKVKELLVKSEEAKAATASAGSSGDRVFLLDGSSLNGQPLTSSNNRITVASGETITGVLKVRVENGHDPGAVVPVIYTPSWGDHSSSWVLVKEWAPIGTSSYDVRVSLTAPTGGTHYIIFGSQGQTHGSYIASLTGWFLGSNRWNDGVDLADMNEVDLGDCMKTGFATLPVLETGGILGNCETGCTYVKVKVTTERVEQVVPRGGQPATAKFTIPAENLQIPDKMQACAANLQKIYAAIKAYEKEKGDLPNWLSDLVPGYLNKETLLCPNNVDRTTAPYYPDPNLPCSYSYEFSPSKAPQGWDPTGKLACRDWKKQQLNQFGDVVPVVRCMNHGSNVVLNVSIGGQVYWSAVTWERMFMPITQPVPKQPSSRIGEPAPTFTLPDLNAKQVSLADFKGKVVLLDFWATWCGPCRTAIPHLEALHKKYKDQGLVVIGMNHERDHDTVKKFAQEQISYIVLLDADEQFKQYGISAIPTAFYIDRQGVIRYTDRGFSPGKEAEMEQKVKELLVG